MENTQQYYDMAIARMFAAIDEEMTKATETETDAIAAIERHAKSGTLSTSDITNRYREIIEADAVKRALGNVAMWARMAQECAKELEQ